jgi:hypothetical protein
MNRRLSTFLFAAVAAIGFVALGTSLSHAADTKVIPGGLCFAAEGSPFRNGSGRLFNSSGTAPMTALCYLVRDNPAAKPTKVEVSVVDNSSATGVKDISCFMRIANRFGNTFASGSTVSTTGVRPEGTILNVPLPAANLADGSIIVVCTIPRHGVGDANSSLASIKYTEVTPAP